MRACDELGIRVFTTSSAESKGRIERVWNTTQDRLIPEMRLANITTMLDANRFLSHVFLPKYWQVRNTVEARDTSSKYRPLAQSEDLNEIFCIKQTRLVNSDHTIHFEAKRYRILDQRFGSLKRKLVTIHVYESGDLGFFYDQTKLSHELIILPKKELD